MEKVPNIITGSLLHGGRKVTAEMTKEAEVKGAEGERQRQRGRRMEKTRKRENGTEREI